MKPKIPNIIFELTRSCNLTCSYCYNHWKVNPESNFPEFGYRQAIHITKRLLKSSDVQTITLSGGEPLLFERIAELILYLRMKKLNINLITNGFTGSEDLWNQLLPLGIATYELPLHSHLPEIHDSLTGKAGSWGKCVNRIRMLIETGQRVVSVVILTPINSSDILATLEFHQSLGIKNIMLNRFNIGGEGLRHLDELMINISDFQTALAIANKFSANEKIHISSNVCTPLCLVDPAEYKNIRFSLCSNDLFRLPVTLELNGNIRKCNHSPIVIGNIFNELFEKIREKESVKTWADYKPEQCSDCAKFDLCLGGCRAASEQFYGHSQKPDPYLEFNSSLSNN